MTKKTNDYAISKANQLFIVLKKKSRNVRKANTESIKEKQSLISDTEKAIVQRTRLTVWT